LSFGFFCELQARNRPWETVKKPFFGDSFSGAYFVGFGYRQREKQGDIERACEESGTAAEIVSNPVICVKV